MGWVALAGLGALLIGAPSLGCGGVEDNGSPTSVEAFDFGFKPGESGVKVGDAVTWTNTGDTIHTVKGPGFFSRAIDPGGDYRFTFRKPGRHEYLCTLHPDSMRGTITVED